MVCSEYFPKGKVLPLLESNEDGHWSVGRAEAVGLGRICFGIVNGFRLEIWS